METKDNKENLLKILLVILVVGFVVTNCRLVNHHYVTYDNTSDYDTSNIENYISELQDEIGELNNKLSKDNSSLDSCKVNWTSCDFHTLKGDVVAKIRLKKYTDDTKVRITIGDTIAKLKLKNGVFIGKLNMDITKIYDEFTVDVDKNGKKSSETVTNISESDEDIGELDGTYFLVEQVNTKGGEWNSDDGEITVEPGKYEIKIPKGNLLKDNPVFHIVSENKEILQKNMTYNVDKKIFEVKTDKSMEMKDEFRIYIQFTLSTGEVVQYEVDSNYDNDGESKPIRINGKNVEFEYMD